MFQFYGTAAKTVDNEQTDYKKFRYLFSSGFDRIPPEERKFSILFSIK